jgi:Fe-S-cluster containining protein
MIVIDKTLISDDLAHVKFVCDLHRCHGACCIEGDAGAPLEMEEISLLEDHMAHIKPFMDPKGVAVIEKNGVIDFDEQGNWVTPLINDEACVFAIMKDGTARCAIEEAFEDGAIHFQKPVSCHLYPVRITKYESYEGINYHRWYICEKALTKGKKEGVYLYQFLKEPLIKKFGEQWYNRLVERIETRKRL